LVLDSSTTSGQLAGVGGSQAAPAECAAATDVGAATRDAAIKAALAMGTPHRLRIVIREPPQAMKLIDK